MTNGKVCRECQTPLTQENFSPSREKRKDYICRECNRKQVREIKSKVLQEGVTREKYSVSDAVGGNIPKIEVIGSHPSEDVLFDMIEDTEEYRIAQMIKLMQAEDDAKNLNKIIVYLLKSWSFLDTVQCAKVLNEANRIIGAKAYDPDVRAKMANDLRAFMVAMKRTKATGQTTKTFEELRKEEGRITVEVPV